MKRLTFEVEFLSDVVLPATSNTEGNIEQLDFIPGSNFLGMVASNGNYDKFKDSFKLFHSGAVRFSDATLLHKGKATYKIPLSFFHEKLKKDEMVNHHLVEDFGAFKQLKQKRKGYITQELEEVILNHNYAQKSAYDKLHRRSKEGSMYGYSAIPSGTKWQFVVQYSELETSDKELLKASLLGKKRLGKSKSSQYGQVFIREVEDMASLPSMESKSSSVILYAKSRIALVDEEGNPTYDLKYLIDGLDDSNIVWEKSQLKTSTFTPYNGAMQTKCYERVVMNAGSVIVLQNLSDEQVERLTQGVGIYLSEGFGELLVNPSFLLEEGRFSLGEENLKSKATPLKITEPIVMFLKYREDKKREKLNLARKVDEFIGKHKKLYGNISNAQWGTVRSICTSNTKNFKDEIRAYVSSGKVEWKENQINELLKDNHSLEFIKLVAMQMPKEGDK